MTTTTPIHDSLASRRNARAFISDSITEYEMTPLDLSSLDDLDEWADQYGFEVKDFFEILAEFA